MRQRLTEDSISRFTRRCRRSGLTRRTAPLTPRLYGSYLYGSYLYGSYLYGSYLYGSYLYGSYLYGSYLYGSCYARVVRAGTRRNTPLSRRGTQDQIDAPGVTD